MGTKAIKLSNEFQDVSELAKGRQFFAVQVPTGTTIDLYSTVDPTVPGRRVARFTADADGGTFQDLPVDASIFMRVRCSKSSVQNDAGGKMIEKVEDVPIEQAVIWLQGEAK